MLNVNFMLIFKFIFYNLQLPTYNLKLFKIYKLYNSNSF